MIQFPSTKKPCSKKPIFIGLSLFRPIASGNRELNLFGKPQKLNKMNSFFYQELFIALFLWKKIQFPDSHLLGAEKGIESFFTH